MPQAKLTLFTSKGILLSLLILLSLIAALEQVCATPDGPPHLFVDPPSIVDPAIQPPAYFNISIKVANVTNLYGYEFNMGYNTTMLNCLGAIIIPFDNETSFSVKVQVKDNIGLIWVNVTLIPPAKPHNTTDPVTLAMIFFQVTNSGESILDLHDTKLTDPSGIEIPHTVSDGYIKIFRHDVAIIDVVAGVFFMRKKPSSQV